MCWYIELEFGHFGRNLYDEEDSTSAQFVEPGYGLGPGTQGVQRTGQSNNFDVAREAWLEWCYDPAFNFRMGQIQLPSTRQMMTAPELQQFVDISYASSWVGNLLPGYTDRNRDHGLMVHGMFGCDDEFKYMLSVSNGDGGDSVRNVLDHRTSDNVAFGFRMNWSFLHDIGYEEGALRQQSCQLYGELGYWAFVYADRVDKAHEKVGDVKVMGFDLAFGYGGFSLTAAYSWYSNTSTTVFAEGDLAGESWLAQLGYHFQGTAWEIAARASQARLEDDFNDGTMTEYAFGVNYYLNGHANKLQLDVTYLEASDDWVGWLDPLPGFQSGFFPENQATMLRFQWQLAL